MGANREQRVFHLPISHVPLVTVLACDVCVCCALFNFSFIGSWCPAEVLLSSTWAGTVFSLLGFPRAQDRHTVDFISLWGWRAYSREGKRLGLSQVRGDSRWGGGDQSHSGGRLTPTVALAVPSLPSHASPSRAEGIPAMPHPSLPHS